jgi:hypothetical protein
MKFSWVMALVQACAHDDSANNQSEEVFKPSIDGNMEIFTAIQKKM